MTIFDSIILGIVEGLSEFLPISSTAHLVLFGRVLNLENTEFLKSFNIIIQLGAIAAVISLYWKTLVTKWDLNKKLLTAFLPTAVIGLSLYKVVKSVFLENYLVPITALIVGGVVLVIFEIFHQEKEEHVENLENISYKEALVVGLFQSLAIVPGVSRAAATVVGGMLLGIKRRTIVEFSFLLAIPTLAAATGLDLVQSASSFSNADILVLAVGFLTSFTMAMVSIKMLLRFVQHHTFTSFGIYRIIFGIGFLLLYV